MFRSQFSQVALYIQCNLTKIPTGICNRHCQADYKTYRNVKDLEHLRQYLKMKANLRDSHYMNSRFAVKLE